MNTQEQMNLKFNLFLSNFISESGEGFAAFDSRLGAQHNLSILSELPHSWEPTYNIAGQVGNVFKVHLKSQHLEDGFILGWTEEGVFRAYSEEENEMFTVENCFYPYLLNTVKSLAEEERRILQKKEQEQAFLTQFDSIVERFEHSSTVEELKALNCTPLFLSDGSLYSVKFEMIVGGPTVKADFIIGSSYITITGTWGNHSSEEQVINDELINELNSWEDIFSISN